MHARTALFKLCREVAHLPPDDIPPTKRAIIKELSRRLERQRRTQARTPRHEPAEPWAKR